MTEQQKQDRDDSEKLRDLIVSSREKGIPVEFENHDLDWLVSEMRADSIGGVTFWVDSLVKKGLYLFSNGSLPKTHAILGSWGSGKTHLLSQLAHRLITEKRCGLVYFNAFKYAAYADIVPCLIYKLLRTKSAADFTPKLMECAEELMLRHAPFLHKGINDVANDARLLRRVFSDSPSIQQCELYRQFYGKVDYFQDLLQQEFKDIKAPIFVLIDELDRCDPMEAFDVMKQLRVLFSLSRVPFFFVIAINPDPIGRYIKKEFGLDESDDYDALKILEKFVDSSFSLTNGRPLGDFIVDLWERQGLRVSDSAFFIGADSGLFGTPTLPTTATQRLPMYSNLRVMEKALSTATLSEVEPHLWSRWHLDLLRISDPEFRKLISQISIDLRQIAEDATVSVLKDFRTRGRVIGGELSNQQSGQFWSSSDQFVEAFKVFWGTQISTAKTHNRMIEGNILENLRDDTNKVTYLAHLCMLDLGHMQNLKLRENSGAQSNIAAFISCDSDISAGFRKILWEY